MAGDEANRTAADLNALISTQADLTERLGDVASEASRAFTGALADQAREVASRQKDLDSAIRAAAAAVVGAHGALANDRGLLAAIRSSQESIADAARRIESENALAAASGEELLSNIRSAQEKMAQDIGSLFVGKHRRLPEMFRSSRVADLGRRREPARHALLDSHSIAGLGERGFLQDEQASAVLRELEKEIATLKADVQKFGEQQAAERAEYQRDAEAQQQQSRRLEELELLQRLGFLLQSIRPEAHGVVRGSEALQGQFLNGTEAPTFVMSIDIRRSTELMLKAKSAESFVEFISDLCKELDAVVKSNNGVVDKFTGDGILAFFPEFFSGKSAAAFVVAVAQRCHEVFDRVYRSHRSSFSSVLTRLGLGIGVDYGQTHLVRIAGGLTVVGRPVVYACRLGSAPAGRTRVNQPAFEEISRVLAGKVEFREVEHEIKHEGFILAYEIDGLAELDGQPEPGWAGYESTEEGSTQLTSESPGDDQPSTPLGDGKSE